MIGHFEVERATVVGMIGRHCFVKLHAQPRFFGRDDVTVLPLDRFLEEFGVEAVKRFGSYPLNVSALGQ